MRLKKTILTVFCLALAAGAPAVERPPVDLAICPIGPMKFMGEVFISTNHSGAQSLTMSAFVWKGGVAASGGVMTLMGQRATGEGKWYHHGIAGTGIHAGEMITVTFQPPWAGLPLYSASLAAPTLVKFTSPNNDAHIAVSGAGNLTIRWSGGTPPYILAIWKCDGGARVFNRTGIPAGSADVPLRTFSAGQRYHVTVYDAKRKFSFDHAVDPASDLGLDQTTSIYFYAD